MRSGLFWRKGRVIESIDCPKGRWMNEGTLHPNRKRRRQSQVFSPNKKRLKSIVVVLTEKEISTTSFPNWLELPDELLGVILNKLTFISDRIRFCAVCHLWKRVYCRHNGLYHCLPPQLPMLLIPTHKKDKLSLYNRFSTGRRRKMYDLEEIRLPFNSHCIGSSQGWLAIEEAQGIKQTSSIRLLNPFLAVNNEIRLPLLAPTPSEPWSSKINKIVLSANPASTSDYVVMAIHSALSVLAFWRFGDEAWTRINCLEAFDDIIYYKHQFYAVNSSGQVLLCDISSPHPVVRLVAESPPLTGPNAKNYLVELSGNLLCILREVQDFKWKTTGCKVFKLDPSKLVWKKLESLCGHILFLGGISSMSVSTSHFPGCCKSNCIYFGYDACSKLGWKASCFDTVVFYLEDGSFERLVPPMCKHSPLWIEPKLHSCLGWSLSFSRGLMLVMELKFSSVELCSCFYLFSYGFSVAKCDLRALREGKITK